MLSQHYNSMHLTLRWVPWCYSHLNFICKHYKKTDKLISDKLINLIYENVYVVPVL